jgi:predicted ArsR family transcriptional regulator
MPDGHRQRATVTELLDDQGYLADFEAITDRHFRINLHNCAIWAVASRFPKPAPPNVTTSER